MDKEIMQLLNTIQQQSIAIKLVHHANIDPIIDSLQQIAKHLEEQKKTDE